MEKVIRVLYDEMYTVKLNGFAIAGWVTASIFGVVYLIKEIVIAFN